jgi:hypothetical protein
MRQVQSSERSKWNNHPAFCCTQQKNDTPIPVKQSVHTMIAMTAVATLWNLGWLFLSFAILVGSNFVTNSTEGIGY